MYSLSEQNRFYKKAAAFVLRSVAKHSPELAHAVVDAGALESLCNCLEEFEPSVREAAAWAIGYIAGHMAELARGLDALSRPRRSTPREERHEARSTAPQKKRQRWVLHFHTWASSKLASIASRRPVSGRGYPDERVRGTLGAGPEG